MEQKSRTTLFLEMSALLTGFSTIELKATSMLETYYNTIMQNTSTQTTDYFFEAIEAILSKPNRTEESTNAAIASQLLPDYNYENLAKKIINLWYTGNWGLNVVSADSYVQGLMWDAGHTHPPGAKQPGYGSWANLPLDVQSSTPKNKSHGK